MQCKFGDRRRSGSGNGGGGAIRDGGDERDSSGGRSFAVVTASLSGWTSVLMSSTGRGGALVVMGLEGPAAGGTILQRPLSEIWQMVTDIVARPDTPDVTPQTTPRLVGSSGGQTRHAPPLLAGFHSSDARKSKKSLLLRWQDSAGDGAPCRCYEYRYESGGSFETLRRLVYDGASVDASGLSFSVQRDDVAGGRERTVSGAMRQRLSSLSAGSLALPDGRFLLLLLTCFKCYNMSPRFLTTRAYLFRVIRETANIFTRSRRHPCPRAARLLPFKRRAGEHHTARVVQHWLSSGCRGAHRDCARVLCSTSKGALFKIPLS